jgi:hypothetical protein
MDGWIKLEKPEGFWIRIWEGICDVDGLDVGVQKGAERGEIHIILLISM